MQRIGSRNNKKEQLVLGQVMEINEIDATGLFNVIVDLSDLRLNPLQVPLQRWVVECLIHSFILGWSGVDL